ncbi:hypothetical protein LshimejAT787_0200100 [Lyophyllum shimeji]|uniref:F-box domain-containing protein n=1 Tax=Lyophyllum shimeji TaxID=47721 RepID=A0A9P3PEC4_LYOSH|nr:hypothetical protein LshimejAT787_0200100 [Lyophyllum shimeji]
MTDFVIWNMLFGRLAMAPLCSHWTSDTARKITTAGCCYQCLTAVGAIPLRLKSNMTTSLSLPPDILETVLEDLAYDCKSLLHLSTLSFSGTFTSDLPIDILTIPPALKSLTFNHWRGKSVSESQSVLRLPSIPRRGPTKLRKLELAGAFTSKLVKYLTHPKSPIQLSDLRELRITDKAWEMVELLSEITKASEGSLECLVWLNQHFDFRDEALNLSNPELDLRDMRELRSCIWPESISVEEIEETLLSEYELDQALAFLCNKEAYPSLQKIKIEFQFLEESKVDAQLVESYIGKWFSLLSKTGYLEGSCILW